MDSTLSILHSAASALGRHGTLLVAVAITIALLAIALAFVALEGMAATSDATLVAPLRWISRV